VAVAKPGVIVAQSTPLVEAKAKRTGLDAMMRDARRGRFDVVLVWASDRIARLVKHFLEVLDELNRLNIEFNSFRRADCKRTRKSPCLRPQINGRI